ncbi:MAG TPA: pyridoxamine 5'-phosphate oxidase [Ignavibacteria bacterium]|nr:pyridoxamine 5'-phosphate oxidase [Ignavibacteria bacterium]
MVNRDLTDIRGNYVSEGLDISSASPDPFVQFDEWFKEYLEIEHQDPNAMTLSTCNKDGRPTSRTVLLKSYDNEGFVFFTNYSSKKGKALEENPNASLLFFMRQLHRQVRIEGKVEKISLDESIEYFHSRPRESQLAALASSQSEVISSREDLLSKYESLSRQYDGQEIPLPPYWGGYRLVPDEFEFWQGRENRLHDRISYKLENDKNWGIRRLSP